MSKAYVEIDFFQMEKRNRASSKPSCPERAPSSCRGIQSVVSRINPQLLKTVMAAGAAGHARTFGNTGAWGSGQLSLSSRPPSPTTGGDQSRTTSPQPPPFSLFDSTESSCCSVGPTAETAPLTIFYNGAVAVFDLPRDKAEGIIRMAETAGVVGNPSKGAEDPVLDRNQLKGDLPIARRKSLERFLEKRKDRLASTSPYHHKVSLSHLC